MLRILMIGDKRSALMLIDTLIYSIPEVTIVSAQDATEALAILSRDGHFDAILIDQGAADDHGEESGKTFHLIKSQDITIPTVILTETLNGLHFDKLFQVGATEFLVQPYSAQTLLNKLEKVLDISLYSEA